MDMNDILAPKKVGRLLRLVEFSIGEPPQENRFGVNISKLVEIANPPESYSKGHIAHPVVPGSIFFRGNPCPVIDLAKWMGKEADDEKKNRILIITANNISCGFLVTDIVTIHEIPWDMITEPPSQEETGGSLFISGLVNIAGDIMLVDFESVIGNVYPELAYPTNVEFAKRSRDREQATVFIVEDSRFVRRRMIETFEKAGYRVFSSDNGQKAFEKLKQVAEEAKTNDIDIRRYLNCIVTDFELPQMNGIELTNELQSFENLGKIPAVLFTSIPPQKTDEEYRSVGISGVIKKPDMTKLIGAVDELVYGSQS